MSWAWVMPCSSSMTTGWSCRGGSDVVEMREQIRSMLRCCHRADPLATASSVSEADWKAWKTGS